MLDERRLAVQATWRAVRPRLSSRVRDEHAQRRANDVAVGAFEDVLDMFDGIVQVLC